MMKIFEYDEAKQVVVCGDMHGASEIEHIVLTADSHSI